MKWTHRLILATLLGCCVAATPAQAATRLTIRLVEASDTNKSSERGLEDIIDLLRKSFRYKYYKLLASTSVPLPADKTSTLGPYTVHCKGAQDGLRITVKAGSKTLVNTSVKLRDKKPLVLGGFKSKYGKTAFVFMAK